MFIFNREALPAGKAIAVKRLIEGKTQKELADELGMPVGTLAKVEQGIRDVPKKNQERVNEYLNKTTN